MEFKRICPSGKAHMRSIGWMITLSKIFRSHKGEKKNKEKKVKSKRNDNKITNFINMLLTTF